jgi:hypothetical protein
MRRLHTIDVVPPIPLSQRVSPLTAMEMVFITTNE